MPTLQQRILVLLQQHDGLTDREITDMLFAAAAPQQPVNQACHSLEEQNHLARRPRRDGKIGNYRSGEMPPEQLPEHVPSITSDEPLSEDAVKQHLKTWLETRGWNVQIMWAKERGIDIDASKDSRRWVIEAKGSGSLNPMRVNYFLAILGETLQRMSDPEAKYSIALPDLPQFRGLWSRLPELAKSRTQITALFVGREGNVTES
jgi:hypothetical protein